MLPILLQFFEFAHLAEDLAAVAKPFGAMAQAIADMFGPDNPQAVAAVQKLLEAKDCAVRACIIKRQETADAAKAPA